MKKIKIIIVLVFLSMEIYSQAPVIRISGGIESSGFVGDIGYGISSSEDPDGDWGSFYGTLGYEAYSLDDNYFQGVKMNINASILFVQMGVNISYINGNEKWKTVFKPEIGITYAGLITLSYTYTVGNVTEFFPENYNRNGFHLAFNIILE